MGSKSTLAVACAVAVAMLLALPAFTHAAAGPGPGGYATHAWPGCGAGTNSGSFDDAGRVYVPCGSPAVIGVYDEAARLVQSIATGRAVTDVAPTRDGRYLYLAGPGAPTRMARQGDGSYAHDPTWRPARYPIWGTSYAPSGHFIATDAAGNVYLADGTWGANLTHTVVKYDSAGNFVTRFGEWANSWQLGTFYWALGGVAVSADGATVYTVELGNNRVQRWRRQASGAYAVADSFGSTAANNADRAGYCDYAGWRGTLAAPYDVALDGADNLYVINTTCKQVLKFAPNFGALLANVDVRVAGGDYPRPHGFAVGRDGTVYVGENQRMLRPGGGSLPASGGAPSAPSGGGSSVPAQPDPPITPRPERPAGDGDLDSPPTATPRPARPASSAGSGAGSGSGSGAAPQRIRGVAIGIAQLRGARRQLVRVPVRCAKARCRVELQVRRGSRLVARRVTWLKAGQRRWVAAPSRAGRRTRAVAVSIIVRDTARAAGTWRRIARVR